MWCFIGKLHGLTPIACPGARHVSYVLTSLPYHVESIVTSLFQRRMQDLRAVTSPQHPRQDSGLGVFGPFYLHYLISFGSLTAKQRGSFFHSFSKYLSTDTVR